MKTLLAALLILLAVDTYDGAWACDKYPVAPGKLIREYPTSSGFMQREFDTNGDGLADYGVAHQITKQIPGKDLNGEIDYIPQPKLYVFGIDKRNAWGDVEFIPSAIYNDVADKGRCADIRLYWVNPKAQVSQ